jgi:hypothetical protein
MGVFVNPMAPQWSNLPDLSIALGSSSKIARPGYALNRPVNKRGAVNGENGEFGGFSEANEQNHDG